MTPRSLSDLRSESFEAQTKKHPKLFKMLQDELNKACAEGRFSTTVHVEELVGVKDGDVDLCTAIEFYLPDVYLRFVQNRTTCQLTGKLEVRWTSTK